MLRDVRFNEMEYEIPAEAGPACVREILKKAASSSSIASSARISLCEERQHPDVHFQGRDTARSPSPVLELDHHPFFAQ